VIRVPEVRLLDEEGEMLGIFPLAKALDMARERSVDLVEVSPNARPPLCRMIDYGRFLFTEKKKEQQTKKVTKAREMKGVRLTFKIDVGDLERQRKLAEKFLTDGHPVRVQMRLRGRERAHMPLAIEKMKNFIKSLEECGTMEQLPRPTGPQIIAMLKPVKK